MTRVDLDAIEAPTDSESGDAQYNADVWELRARITAMVAELRPAREVVAAADLYWTTFGDEAGGAIPDRLAHALNAYEEAVAS